MGLSFVLLMSMRVFFNVILLLMLIVLLIFDDIVVVDVDVDADADDVANVYDLLLVICC